MQANAIDEIRQAFEDVPPLTDDEAEVRRFIDDLMLMRPQEFHRFLPQVLLYLLRFPRRVPQLEVLAVLQDLNVKRVGAERFYDGMSRDDVAYYQRRFADLRRSREHAYAGFNRRQAKAIVAFLNELKEWPVIDLGEADWSAAMEYWTDRAKEE